MEPTVRVIVRAVRERADYVSEIVSAIPSAEVVWDTTGNAMDTFKVALEVAGRDGVVHMEDDAVLCAGFFDRVSAEVRERPGDVVQFFSRRKDDVTIGSRLVSGGSFMCAVCFYLPPAMSEFLLEYAQTWPRADEHPTGIDLMVADYLKSIRQRFWVVVPNPADHRVCRSVIDPRRSRFRQSRTFQQ